MTAQTITTQYPQIVEMQSLSTAPVAQDDPRVQLLMQLIEELQSSIEKENHFPSEERKALAQHLNQLGKNFQNGSASQGKGESILFEINKIMGLLRQALNKGLQQQANTIKDFYTINNTLQDNLGKESVEMAKKQQEIEAKMKQAGIAGDVAMAFGIAAIVLMIIAPMLSPAFAAAFGVLSSVAMVGAGIAGIVQGSFTLQAAGAEKDLAEVQDKSGRIDALMNSIDQTNQFLGSKVSETANVNTNLYNILNSFIAATGASWSAPSQQPLRG